MAILSFIYSGHTIRLPGNAQSVTSATINGGAVTAAFSAGSQIVSLTPPPNSGDAIVITYTEPTAASNAGTMADGADVNAGSVNDAANTTGTAGTMSGKLRGIVQNLVTQTAAINALASGAPQYTNDNTITMTTASLGTGTWRQSAVVDNTSNLFVDALLGGSFQTGTTPTVNTTIEVYVYAAIDVANSIYTGGCSGSDATYTANGEDDELILVQTITVAATSDKDYRWGPVSVCAMANWPCLPPKWGVVIKNNTGAAFNATGANNRLKFHGVK